MTRKLLNAYIKGKPHIKSRIKMLKKDWSTIFDMVQRCGNSGFRWDNMKNMVTVEEPIWESYLTVSIAYELLKNIYELLSFESVTLLILVSLYFFQSHKDAAQFRSRSFNFYEQLCQIYAKDRASGRDVQTAADILEEIEQEVNVAINEDTEDGNQSNPGLEEMDISSISRQASISSKKRKAYEMGEVISEESFVKVATLLVDKISEVGKELSKSLASEMVIQQRVQELYGALCEIDGLTEDEMGIALSKISYQSNQMLVFFSLPSNLRLGWIRRFPIKN